MWGVSGPPLKLTPALIVEADPAMQRRLSSLLAGLDASARTTAVGTLAEAYDALGHAEFSIALVSTGLPDGDGHELVAFLHREHGQMQVLAIFSRGHEDTALEALRAGATGCLLKEREDIELSLSLRSVQWGGAPIDPLVARCILKWVPQRKGASMMAGNEDVRLSARELEVLQLLARGCSNREIADLVTLSQLTIEGYIKAVYRKLAVHSRTSAVFEAQKLGLLR